MRPAPRARAMGALAVVIILVAAGPSVGVAQTTLSLGQAAQYGVFEVSGSSSTLTLANSSITGKVGLGAHTKLVSSLSTVTGTVTNPVSAQANTDAINAASQAAGLKATGSIAGNSVRSVGGTVTFKGQAGQNVVNLTGINLTNATFAINGTSTETFIFKVSGAITLTNSVIKLSGVSASQVLFDVTTKGGAVTLTNSTSNGTFLDLNGPIKITGGSTTGALISEGSITITSDKVNSQPMAVAAPEMPTILMGGLAGLLMLARAGRDRLRRRRAATAPPPR
jgi:hypothetical protein